MPINVDTVYQKVLTIANKEQRGYITPQEFNLFANQAQISIFDQHFYDINQFSRLHGNDTEYSDMLGLLNEKIAAFKRIGDCVYNSTGGFFTLPLYQGRPPYKLGTVIFRGQKEVEEVNENELLYMNLSPLTKPTRDRPVYTQRHAGPVTGAHHSIFISPTNITTNVAASYISFPADVHWGYVVVNDQALYNAGESIDFELHPSDEEDLVLKILKYAGVSIKDLGLLQAAASEEMQIIQQEKQ